jgi:hypothetical protein
VAVVVVVVVVVAAGTALEARVVAGVVAGGAAAAGSVAGAAAGVPAVVRLLGPTTCGGGVGVGSSFLQPPVTAIARSPAAKMIAERPALSIGCSVLA